MTNEQRDGIIYEIAVINAQIMDIETRTYRPLREIALGIDTTTAEIKLTEYNDAITDLRTQRAALSAQLN